MKVMSCPGSGAAAPGAEKARSRTSTRRRILRIFMKVSTLSLAPDRIITLGFFHRRIGIFPDSKPIVVYIDPVSHPAQ
jgi:hypothetical protein